MKSVSVYLLTLLVIPYPVWSEDIYLEGISIVGAKKNAYLFLDGTRVVVSEGEAIGSWQVKQIIHKAVLLSAENGKQTTLALHARLAPMESQAVSIQEPLPDSTEIEEAVAEPPPLEIPQPQEISDEEIPPGHHRVNTPFGNFIVKDSTPDTYTILQLNSSAQKGETAVSTAQPLSVPPDGTVPAGYRKINTPFGEFLVADDVESTPADGIQLE